MSKHARNTSVLRLQVSLFISFVLIALLWLMFFVQQSLWHKLYLFGVLPRTLKGLVGIITAPFIHGSFKHLYSNSLPLFALTMSLFYFHPHRAWSVFLRSWLVTYALVWLIGRESYHIGASGLLYALTSFHFFYGITTGKKQMIALSLIVVFLYGSAIWGMMPSFAYDVSWEAHLSGYVTGFILALLQSPPSTTPSEDDKLKSNNGFYLTPDINIHVDYKEKDNNSDSD